MKLKKHISKLLFCSMLFNSTPFYSSAASNSNLSRYETLEGEFIDLGDTKSEDISEIEVFGNTIQDENNLEDIQSVGELYVDKEGNPILDKEGRRQYKIEIVTKDKYIDLSNMKWNRGNISIANGIFTTTDSEAWNRFHSSEYLEIIPNSNYITNLSNNPYRVGMDAVFFYDKNKNYIGYKEGKVDYFTTPSAAKYITIRSSCQLEYYDYVRSNIQINLSSNTTKINGFVANNNSISNVIEILLPFQLMKIGNVSDRLYWDNTKSKYMIEKKIGFTHINKDNEFVKINENNDTATVYGTNMIPDAKQSGVNHSNYINSITPRGYANQNNKEGCMSSTLWGRLAFSVFKERLTSDTVEGFKEFIKNGIDVYYELKESDLIETNITKKIELKNYPDGTYISTIAENGINPTLKITIDRIEEVSEEAVNNVISNPTSNNIALARMFINMLPESLYKDQLQAQLNEIFSEDMVLEKQSATANLDVYVKSENILMMSLDTNMVTFEDYSGVEELELQNAINISINSSLPYQLNAYIVGEITNKDKDKTLDLDVLNIREDREVEYKKFDSINSKLVLLDNIEKGNNNSHNIDLKLSGNKAYDADVYKTTIKFEAEQK